MRVSFGDSALSRPERPAVRFQGKSAGHRQAKSDQDEFIMVTGGAGYIGSHFVNRYLQQKPAEQKVLIVDDLSEGHREAVKALQKMHPDRIRFVKARIGDRKVKTMMGKYRVKAVVDFAASISVGESQAKPMKYLKNNVGQTLDFLESMQEAGVKNIVFSSTAATYGNPTRVPIRETQRKKPVNVYGETKLMVEQMLRMLKERGQLSYVALRYFNAAGADESGNIGESHREETHLVPLVLQAASGKRQSIKQFGEDYDTPDGTCIRDYIHVNDLADAHVKALDYLERGQAKGKPVGLSLNLGTGTGNSVREVIERCKALTGRNIQVDKAPRRDGDPAVLVASSDKAQKLLGWKPKYTLDDIIRSAWNWEQNRRY